MSRNTKTRQRLFYLLAGTLVLGTLLAGAYMYRRQRNNQRALQGRADGLAAMERGDYAAALPQFNLYVGRYPNDADIWLSFAKARRLVEEPNGRHLGQAIAFFKRVLELRPGLPEAQTNLLELYSQVNYNTEALSTADAILERTPDDANALYLKIQALLRMHRLDQAAAIAQKLITLAPLNLDYQYLVIQIMLARGQQADVEAYADKLAQAHPDEVRFVLIKSYAAGVVGNLKSAAALVRPLVARPPADAAYTLALVRQLDGLELFADAFTVLQQAIKDIPDRELMRLWVRRLFETNRLPMLLEQTAALDPADANTDVEALGMRALALTRLDRRPEAALLLTAMDQRGLKESAAKRWAAALRVLMLTTSDPVQTIGLLRDALTGSGNTVLLEQLGDAYAAAGARDKAFTIWNVVARQAPAWSAPFVRLSQSYIAGGRSADALLAAKAAQLRAPEDHDALLCLVIADAASLPEGPSAQATQVLARIVELEQRFPKDFELLSLHAGVLAQTRQREPASAVIRSILAASPVAPENVLLSLAGLSESFKLDLEDACFEASQKAYGLTVDLAFARARWLLNHQRGPEGLALLDQARAGHGDDLLWRNAWAAGLDMINDPRAKAEWIALGDANPNNVKIQWAALSARAAQADHDFMGRTIDRLTELLGEDSLALRLVRARWYLQGTSTEADTSKASILLSDLSRNAPDMIAPKLLLATCYMRLGNISGAIDQLAAVSDMQPEQAGIAVELARLLQSRGDYARARQYLDRATRSKSASLQNMRQAASLLALQGDYTAALALLEKTYSTAATQQAPDLVLAALYRQLNQPQKAEEICRQLLTTPDASIIAFCADFYASQNRPADAQKALALLDGLKLPPGTRELILADYATRYGTPDETLKQFQAAAQAAPTEAVVWQQLVAYCLGTGKIDEALAAADQANKKVTGGNAFEALRKNAVLIKDAARVPGTRQLLMMLTGASAGTEPVLDALRTIVAAQQQKEPARQTVSKLRKLADANPRILPLQTITLQFYMDAGQTDEAVSMATRVVQSFPAAIEPLRMATSVMGAAQQWSLALGTAQEWKRLGAGETLEADLAIAAAQLNLGNAAAASQQIQPYLERALLDPDKFSGVILLRAQGLLASRQPEQVETLFTPLLPKSAQWRGLWMSFAVQGLADSARAQAWLEQVTPLVTDNNEKTALAQAWIILGKRWSNPAFDLKGRTLLQTLVQAPDAPYNALYLMGNLCEASADWAGAERAYRMAIQKYPTAPIPYNNLAYVLVQNRGNLQEAQQLIAKALELMPNTAALMDTKAAIQAALKDYAGAVASLKEARSLEPQNLEWRVNLLAILIESGQTAAAKTESQQISIALSAAQNVAPELRQRYDALRSKLP